MEGASSILIWDNLFVGNSQAARKAVFGARNDKVDYNLCCVAIRSNDQEVEIYL